MPHPQSRNYVRARLKPISEIPKDFVCCDAMRQRFVDTGQNVVYALTNSLFEAEIECPFCHRILDNVSYMEIKRNGRATCISIACYEFDEGILEVR